MQSHSIGIHLMLLPAQANMLISFEAVDYIKSSLSSACLMNKCIMHESYIAHDHVHVLVEAQDEDGVVKFIPNAIEAMSAAITDLVPDFKFDNGVHVTILPPWHIEILSAFLRDQERYHINKTVQQELDEVFKPGLVGTFDFPDAPAELLSPN